MVLRWLTLVETVCLSSASCTPGMSDADRCGSYGWGPGTDGFAQCMQSADMQRRGTLTKSIRDAGRTTIEFAPAASVRANLESFAAAASGGPAYPVPPEQMIATIAALEAVFRSARSNAIEAVAD